MKNLLRKYSVILVVSVVPILFAGRVSAQLHTVKKAITKSYSTLKYEQLVISNQYGDVVVKTWNKKKILIRIEISAQAKTINTADQLVKRVHIEANRNAGEITCKSVIGNYLILSAPVQIRAKTADTIANAQGKAITIEALPKQLCTIGYQIYVPADLSLKISNRFGNVLIGDYAGQLDIDEKFGDVTGGVLSGPVKFNLEQGNLTIADISYGQVVAKGFDNIRIAGLSGKVISTYSSGKMLDITLKDKIDSLNIDADNVHEVNIRGVKEQQASYLVQSVVSKVAFNNVIFKDFNMEGQKKEMQRQSDSILLRPEVKAALKSENPRDTLPLKKKLNLVLISKLKRMHEYKAGPDSSKAKVRVKVSFSTLNLME